MFDKNKDTFTSSDAYDLVQDVNIFLLSHVGRLVDEVLYYDKKGYPITICKASTRLLTNMLGYNIEILKSTVSWMKE